MRPVWPTRLACAVLMNTIVSMVLISIHPFALPKILFAIVAFLCFSALCFADPVLMVRRYASNAERLTIPRVSPSSSQEPVGNGRRGIADAYFANFGSTDMPAPQTRPAASDGSSIGLRPAVSSSVFRDAACTMCSNGVPAQVHNRRTLPGQLYSVAL
jgi:hypothetical protein